MKKYFKYYVVFLALTTFAIMAERSVMYGDSNESKIELIYSNIYTTQLSMGVESFELKEILNNSGKYRVAIENGTSILEEGMPDIPKLSTSVIIPDNTEMELSILSYEYTEYQDIHVAPSKGNLNRSVIPDEIPFSYSDIYKTDSFYPGHLADIGDPYILRDLRGSSIIFYPIQYNAYTKVLRVYSNIEILIESKGSSIDNVLQRKNSSTDVKVANEFNHIYNNLFINYNTDTRFEYLIDQGNMLIISYDDFIDEMQTFVDWKNKKGIPTEIIGINSIGSSASAMQAFINNYYQENGLTFLLLVGDINQMPTHIVNGAASDASFGFIEGNDSFAEVIVGRFSANNPSQLNTQIERTLDYEQNPDSDGDWYASALGVGSNQGPGYGGLSDAEFNDLLWNDLLSNFTYNSYQGIFDPTGSVSQGVDAVNDGVGVINYTGHAGPTGWGNGAPLGVNDVNNLTNTNKLPFIFTVGCNPGEFNNYGECFCESWMWATDDDGNPTGAVAHLGSTISQSWEPPMHGQWAMNAILTESYDDNITRTYGGVVANGCMHMNEAQGSSGVNETNHWTIFGDPSLLIRTDSPQEINAIYDNVITVGQEEFVVDVGTDGILVAISSDGELLSSAYSNGGIAILNLENVSNEPGIVDMVITGFNSFPHESELNIITPDGAYLVYSNFELVNSQVDFVEYGQEVQMNLIVENVGTMNTNGINVEVFSSDEYITIINSESMIAYAIVSEEAVTEQPIIFSVSNDVPDGHMAQFSVVLSNEEVWNFNFSVEAHAPVFEIANPVIIDSNGDGVWDAGEDATIIVDLINSGSSGFGYYPGATISTDNPYITILSEENANTFYGIDANTVYEGTFFVQANEDTPLNTEVEFNISWGYSSTAPCDNDYFSGEGCVEQADFLYSVIVGHPTTLIWDPSDNHSSGDRLSQYFDEIGFNGYDYFIGTDVPDTDNYSKAFILLGVYPENYQLQENDVTGFIEILNNDGSIYLEGNDTWAFDMQTSLQGMFGLIGVNDGTSDLLSVVGSEGSFAEGLYMSYNGGNSYIDQLAPSDGFALLENDVANYVTAVAYDNDSYRTIGASHELGGLQGDDFNAYIEGILNFFDQGGGNIEPPECSIGDLNEDGLIDVLDIIRVVSIIVSSGLPPTDLEICASDINADGNIDILDILVLINIIIDDNSRLSRSEVASEVILSISNDKLEIESDGPIKGLELIVHSNSEELDFNLPLGMELAYNVTDDKHYILIYSMQGNVINNGILFESVDSFEIIEFKAANSCNDFVNIVYSDITNPDTFVLKQNYPNPFNPSTTIEFELGAGDNVDLSIYDINGRKISTLAQGYYNSGTYSYVWDGKDSNGSLASSGIYLYTLISSDQIITNRMLLLK